MDPRRRLALLVALAATALLALPTAARAAWFPAEAIDGPSADILALGGIDVARDGLGALAYVKNDGGVPHVFVSRIWLGVWRPPERVDVGIGQPASDPVVSVGDNGRIVVTWISEGRVYGVLADGGAGAPFGAPQFIAGDGARTPQVDLGINGTAYVTYTADGPGGSDVRAARQQGTTWEPVPSALDVDAAQAAGNAGGRPRVGVSAEGNAVVVWGEDHRDARRRIYGRRVTGLTLSVAPQEVSVPDLAGGLGGNADLPDLDIEDDGSYAWATFTEHVGGVPRVLARRLVGSTFDPAVIVDGGPGSGSGRVAINGKGVGLAANAGPGNAVNGALLELDVFGTPATWAGAPNTVPPQPVVGAADNDDIAVAWLRGADGAPIAVFGRHRVHDTTPDFDAEALISQPAFGPAAPDGRLEMATSRLGDVAVAFLQGAPGEHRLVAASYDRPPGKVFGLSNTKPRKERRPRLKWRPGVDLWGKQSFKVLVDDVEIGTTDRSFFRPPAPLTEGPHLWKVIATDRRGQVAEMEPRVVDIDSTPPRLSVRVTGRRAVGSLLTIRIRASDLSGLKSRWIEFGDGTKAPVKRQAVKRYSRRGLFKLTVAARDQARNVARKVVRVRIR